MLWNTPRRMALSVNSRNHRSSRHEEFVRFLNTVNKEVPKGLQVHMILDNYATHKHADVQQWLAKHKRFHLHFTRRPRRG